MSKTLRPIPIHRLLEHIAREMEMSSTVFSVPPGYRGTGRGATLPFGRLELPLGVAPGPHSQMAQNLICAYVAGARAFGLTTVSLAEPDAPGAYIQASGHCRRRVRGGSLSLEEMTGEFIKGSFVIQLLARELGLGDPRGTIFAMGVPGDRAVLESPELTAFFDAMADASSTPLWEECRQGAREAIRRFNNVDKSCLDELDPHISAMAILDWTGSAEALENAADYLLETRGLHTYIKLTPAALGTLAVEAGLAAQGEGDAPLDRAAFGPTVEELAPTIVRLAEKAKRRGLTLGLELSGSLPLLNGEALGGPGLTTLTLELAARVAGLCPELPMAYSGGANYFNAAAIRAVGFETVNVCTTLLKPGGYLRLRQMARALSNQDAVPGRVDPKRAAALAAELGRPKVRTGRVERVRIQRPLPMLDCFAAPCAQAGCPFGEDIPGALRLMSDGRYRDALRVILDRNPLPNLTGAICPQPCQGACTRIFYDQPIQVREAEALCARTAWSDLLARLEPAPPLVGRRVAVVGGSPGGMAAAFLLARRGVPVTLFEEAETLCSALRAEDPRLGELADKDGELLNAMEVDLRLGAGSPDPARLLQTGYSHVVLAPWEEKSQEGQMSIAGTKPCPAETPERIFRLSAGNQSAGGVADAIRDAHVLVERLLEPAPPYPHPAGRRGGAMGKKGKLRLHGEAGEECERCLECATVCECCVDVCPNRANVPITVLTRGRPQILHLDALCDHCGNCGVFCPYEGAPHREKFTLFETVSDLENSQNPGFAVLDFLSRKVRLRLEGQVRDASLRHADRSIPAQIQELMETIFTDYPYLLDETRKLETAQVSLWEE